jgi:hypothetical protein
MGRDVTCTVGTGNKYRNLVGKLKSRDDLKDLRRRYEGNIKIRSYGKN